MHHAKFQLVCIISVNIKKRKKRKLTFRISPSMSFGQGVLLSRFGCNRQGGSG